MTATAPTVTWNHERFRRNLEGLAVRQPELARKLEELELPETIEPVSGRDGTPTFRILGPDGCRRWLGRTSMPSISAAAVIEHFDLAGSNALLPTVGTLMELDLLCRRLPRHAAVFAYDDDPLNVKLALHVTDVAEHLSTGRAVLLTNGEIQDLLPEFLAAHGGYDFPHRMLVHPAVGKEAFERLRVASEVAASVTTKHQLQVARAAANALAGTPRPSVGERPRVVVLSGDPRPEALSRVRQLAGALADLDWPAEAQAPASPAECHNMARLLLIRDFRPDLVLIFNTCAGRLTEFIPADQPVASWFWPGSAAGAAAAAGYHEGHRMFAATPALCEQLRQAGVASERIALLEIAVDTCGYRPVEIDAERRALLGGDVAIFADAVDASADAVGIKHDSQLRLWAKIRELTTLGARAHRAPPVAATIAAAERDTGVRITSADVRERFVQAARERLTGNAAVYAAVAHLRRADSAVRVWGSGWDGYHGVADVVAGPLPDPPVRNEIYQCARAVVVPFFDSVAAQTLLEVTAAGGLGVYRSPEADLKSLHPQTAEALDLLPRYEDLAELVSLLSGSRNLDSRYASNAAPARELVVAEHSLTRRLRAIRDAMRSSG